MGSQLDKETNVQKHNSSHHKHGIHQVNLDDTNKISPRSHIFKQPVNKNCVDLKSRCSFSSSSLTVFVVVFRVWCGSDMLLGMSMLGDPPPWQR